MYIFYEQIDLFVSENKKLFIKVYIVKKNRIFIDIKIFTLFIVAFSNILLIVHKRILKMHTFL